MMPLQDALYNWLTIKVVTDARSDDRAALETEEMFFSILNDDHGISNIQYEKNDGMYNVQYLHENERKQTRFPIELIEIMLTQIQAEPEKYVNYPENE
ncbi:hypothetical protein ACUXCC_004456 [Cytobacillus horneckiae]|uniref:Uncharacterized protein n=2 Tax=Cytobacillus horneckiae TaxID=549687 RepID=A0A2N0ZKD6_9BACI|nr:hypothetical protein [Cytobacillus horneckiae]MBN6889189.1 hypothetical protein [Cytobacillus horneckiae]MCM3178407.1 hypothetical protein [Cytobacillus horneckiae]MEC1156854.1 hypothetical protein [Cytobacillus horneckiae]MED2940453.1 hypothetical protein [Cytobacillus horneckiae]PKG29977.1 hypothetical protein CWS20_05555 [Cytobacillus horneckiae]